MNRTDTIIEPRFTRMHGENIVVESMAKLSMEELAWEAWKKITIDWVYSEGRTFDEQESREEFQEWLKENI